MSQQMGSEDMVDLVQQMQQSEDDPRRCYALVKQRIVEFRRSGREIPEHLAHLERTLMEECMAESQGR